MVYKKIISFLVLICVIFSFNTYIVFASEDLTLVINGKTIESDVKPTIVESRTMVPIRVVCDSLGVDIEWDGFLRQVTVSSPSLVMVFTIDYGFVYVNGVSTPIDVPPVIINDRTLVPARFIAEKLGYKVDWNDSTRTVSITNESYEPGSMTDIKPNLSKINASAAQDAIDITISLSSKLEPKVMTLSSPDRLVFDFYNVKQICSDSKITFDSSSVKEIRWAKHDEYTRIVVETAEPSSYSVKYTSTACIITIPVTYNTSSDKSENDEKVVFNGSVPIVVIDAGHGGYDSGAVGYDSTGQAILKEKELNLTISQRVTKKLEEIGVNVIMTRSSDVALGNTLMTDLVTRSEIANKAGADLFVSIHNNAYTNSEATGTTVLYAGLANSGSYGITSYELAENILAPLAEATGLRNRGTVKSPNMVVLKKTDMPAALVECAFVTSYVDQKVLSDPEKLKDIGDAIFEGIVVSLRQMGKIQ